MTDSSDEKFQPPGKLIISGDPEAVFKMFNLRFLSVDCERLTDLYVKFHHLSVIVFYNGGTLVLVHCCS